MKRLLVCALLGALSVHATVLSGKIVDLTGQPMTSNRTVTFTLQNCGNNIPQVVGSSIVVPATKTYVPSPAGALTGTIIGNDVISCGTIIGQTYYQVQIFNGTQMVWSNSLGGANNGRVLAFAKFSAAGLSGHWNRGFDCVPKTHIIVCRRLRQRE